MTALFFRALPMTGAKGGEQMSEMLVVSVVSVSMRKRALSRTWKKSEPNVAMVMKRKMSGLTSVRVFRLTCDATAMLKMRMKNVPASKVRLRLLTRLLSEARMESKLMPRMKTLWKESLGKR